MAYRREYFTGDHFDLLPFIAILMCVLGCLLLVTMSMAALSIGPGAGEGWIPVRSGGSSQASKIPILIEWDGDIAVFHLKGKREGVKWTGLQRIRLSDGTWISLQTEQGNNNDEFNKLMDVITDQKATHYALIAVRPSGFKSFRFFSYEFRNRDITIGYEPIPQERLVRLLKSETGP